MRAGNVATSTKRPVRYYTVSSETRDLTRGKQHTPLCLRVIVYVLTAPQDFLFMVTCIVTLYW